MSVRYSSSPPQVIPLIVGEAIHALRTALDYMIWELVDLCGGTQTRDIDFPIRETREKLMKSLNTGPMQILGPDITSLILDKIKPYSGGNNPLVDLHNLDIRDKHHSPIIIYSIVALKGISGHAGGFVFEDNTAIVGENGVVNLFGLPSKPEFENNGYPELHVVFDQGQPFQGQPIIRTLDALSQLVVGIVQDVESTYLARSQMT